MKKLIFSIICALLPILASAQEPYAILIDNGTALEFRYDDQKSAYRDAMSVGPFNDIGEQSWLNYHEQIISVVFDSSFANCTSITSTYEWFYDLSNLETIVGLEYLNTNNVTTMFAMFYGCSKLSSLDLSHFNTESVTNMRYMFFRCSNLTTIKVGSGWSTSQVSASDNMFYECTSLVGGAGTTYSSNHTDASFAHIDSENDPGYLTGATSGDEPYWQELQYTISYGTEVMLRARNSSSVDPWMVEELEMFLERADEMYNERTASEQEVRHMIEELNWIIREVEEAMNRPASDDPEPYAVLSDNNTVLTFYYDDQKSARGGMSVGPFTTTDERWAGEYEHIRSVVFDPSMANCTSITSTAQWFAYCNELTSISGLQYLNTSNVTSMVGMFHRCTSLRSIDVSHFNTENVTNMSYMFANCYELESLDLSNFNTSNVTEMSYMFFGDGSTIYTSLDLSSFNTRNVTSTVRMFAANPVLATIYVGSEWNMSKVDAENSLDMFYNCERLVGGRGTNYNPNHRNVEYAHIDGGTANPGYLTDINGSGSSDLDQRRAELLDMIEQLVQQIDVCAYELSRKDPQRTSDLWAFLVNIEEAIYDVRDRTERAESDAELDECEERIRQIREEIDYLYMRIAEYAVGDASFDGLTARVSGSATLDDAFESVGGRAVAAQTIAAIVWNADNALTADMLTGINNPNLLVYVTEASKAPSGVQNVVINGTAAEIVLTDASGNNNFYCPQSFTAQSISYTRNFSQTTQIDVCQGWETICLPFTVQSVRHQSHGALTPFGGGDNGYPFWLRLLSGNGLTRATQIQANVPYLISMPNNTVYPSVYNQAGNVTFSASNVTVPVTSAQTSSGAGVTLRAAFQQVAQGSGVYALNVGEARGSYPEGSVFEQNYRGIRPFQAYTNHNPGTRFITLMSLGLGGDDATGIDAMLMDNEESNNDTWYSLDGRRLDSKPTKKGVYIRSGKKIVIK